MLLSACCIVKTCAYVVVSVCFVHNRTSECEGTFDSHKDRVWAMAQVKCNSNSNNNNTTTSATESDAANDRYMRLLCSIYIYTQFMCILYVYAIYIPLCIDVDVCAL
jgi:hypothetical protein